MPLYEYECEACRARFEVIRKFSDPVLEVCTHCGKGPVRRLQSSPAFQFKGSGWYITDYARKGKSGGETETSKKDSSDTKKDSDKASDSSTPSADATPAKTDTPTPTSTPKGSGSGGTDA